MSVQIRPKVRDVNTSDEKSKDPYNTAIAELFRGRKAELQFTFVALEAASGIKLRQLKVLLHDEAAIRMGDFIRLTTALDLDPADVIQRAADRAENTAA